MKILKKILSLMLICILFSTTVHAQGETLDTNKDEIYEKVLEAYRKGDNLICSYSISCASHGMNLLQMEVL